jgi:hypothetical protein
VCPRCSKCLMADLYTSDNNFFSYTAPCNHSATSLLGQSLHVGLLLQKSTQECECQKCCLKCPVIGAWSCLAKPKQRSLLQSNKETLFSHASCLFGGATS